MKRKRIIFPLLLVVVAAATAWFFLSKKESGNTTFSFAEITRGDIENTVDATGTIEPVTTVEVGTQVSGIIDKIFVDFNDTVVRNQLMAVIDTTILSVQVSDAKASLLRSQAQYDEANYNYERTEQLFERELISELEYVTAKSAFQSAKSSLLSAQNNLERAERNMLYAFIRSPINGTVIYREIEEGQTVASSFQTPRLFLIAEDLSKMEIHALVDESEIGLIKVGQPVRFDVQAYDDKVFEGTVRQVWLQPETVQNVVNYTVVVDAENPDGFLLPGMTATLDFIVEQKEDVLMVPVTAARIQPTQSMMEAMLKNLQKQFGGNPPAGGQTGGGFPGMAPALASGVLPADFSETAKNGTPLTLEVTMLWRLDENKELQTIPVKTGSSDGRFVEIIPMPNVDIKAGMQIISEIETDEASTEMTMPGPPGFGRPF